MKLTMLRMLFNEYVAKPDANARVAVQMMKQIEDAENAVAEAKRLYAENRALRGDKRWQRHKPTDDQPAQENSGDVQA